MIPRLLPTLRRGLSTAEQVKKTCLYDFHIQKGGKMVEFAGYSMPMQYIDMGIGESHQHTRKKCSIFDVSHMQQSKVYGKDRRQFIESLTTLDLKTLKEDSGSLTIFTNEKGGIVDDLIVMNTSLDFLYLVTNAGCKEKDILLMKKKVLEMKSDNMDIELEIINDHALIAIQGPKMAEYFQPHTDVDLKKLKFMQTSLGTVCGVPMCRITRCGYTGEDGVEVSIPNEHAEAVLQKLTNSNSSIKLAGLGARDSLRLEAGLCLYGNDMNEDITPVEASLNWLISKSRRKEGGFPGHSIILNQLSKKDFQSKRIGLVSNGPPPRSGMEILDSKENQIGVITSGCPSPTLKHNVAMGYINKSMSKIGNTVYVKVRNKIVEATISKMPFVKCNYFN
ncbi:aminomethyltransferase, mitochondrial [Lepeophtheirus salmonis]|uniref:Aminomethyltransferase n=2 Tax=Lepeophtheirus salmonis TaxID=72036 RepID=C1BUW9_LEPSM|nr:aminomethyltransferase, mitochondrial-like [Lepeophtheirus salmonis]XP_040568244.1 aminomethyltransferase, mitochondrial-like [Lepeophtheirus salmonis]ACO12822.1 Aminomethyltransferase, mitochondrial precursor [Lepeophtheirus salmonis]